MSTNSPDAPTAVAMLVMRGTSGVASTFTRCAYPRSAFAPIGNSSHVCTLPKSGTVTANSIVVRSSFESGVSVFVSRQSRSSAAPGGIGGSTSCGESLPHAHISATSGPTGSHPNVTTVGVRRTSRKFLSASARVSSLVVVSMPFSESLRRCHSRNAPTTRAFVVSSVEPLAFSSVCVNPNTPARWSESYTLPLARNP
jgi:hypothetical protein